MQAPQTKSTACYSSWVDKLGETLVKAGNAWRMFVQLVNERAKSPVLGRDAVVAPMNCEKTVESAWTRVKGISTARQRRDAV